MQLVKLELVCKPRLPTDISSQAQPREVTHYRQRVLVDAPYELRRRLEPWRMTASAFAHVRGGSLTDGLVNLLIETSALFYRNGIANQIPYWTHASIDTDQHQLRVLIVFVLIGNNIQAVRGDRPSPSWTLRYMWRAD